MSEPTARRPDRGPVLPEVTDDELPERTADPRDEDRRSREWYERERPPHHDR
ncbi:MAG: hypothetical protein FWD74_02035 [Actinomycetia bacterium]|nr:hypothetical protein [Actinomycetes bacterium]